MLEDRAGPFRQEGVRVSDQFWSDFGTGEGWSYGRCNRCIEHVYGTNSPSEDTVNCWKVLIFADAVSEFGQVEEYLVEQAKANPRWLGKFRNGHAMAVVYATSEIDRDALKLKIFVDLRNKKLLKKEFLPYRRGCKTFEKVLGPWREWKVEEVKISKETILSSSKIPDNEIE